MHNDEGIKGLGFAKCPWFVPSISVDAVDIEYRRRVKYCNRYGIIDVQEVIVKPWAYVERTGNGGVCLRWSERLRSGVWREFED